MLPNFTELGLRLGGGLLLLSVATASPAPQKPAPKGDAKPAEKAAQGETAPKKAESTASKGQDEAGKTQPSSPGSTENPGNIPDETLFEPYARNDGLLGRLQVLPKILAMTEDVVANRVVPRLTGERKRLILEVKELVQALGDVRYSVRVEAGKKLLARGPRIRKILDSLPPPSDLEIKIRLDRVKRALESVGQEDIERDARVARGLAEALMYRKGLLETRALISALDYLDARVRLPAIRSLGVQLREPEIANACSDRVRKRLADSVRSLDLELRNAATTTLGMAPGDASRQHMLEILGNTENATSHRILALRLLLERSAGSEASENAAELVSKLEGRDAELMAAIGAYLSTRKAVGPEDSVARMDLELEDGGKLSQTTLLGTRGDCLRFAGPKSTGGVPLSIPRAAVSVIRNPKLEGGQAEGMHILLRSGTRLRCEKLSMAGESVRFVALGKEHELPKSELRGILPDAKRGRALGGSRRSDQIRLLTGKPRTLEGTVTGFDDEGITLEVEGKTQKIAWKSIESQLFQLAGPSGTGDTGDINQFVQVDMAGGERLVGYLLALDGRSIGIADIALGCIELPLDRVVMLKLSNSGRALTGFTLVADYGNTAVLELDGEGRVVWKIEDLFDPLDAELTPSGTILITEQQDDAVREYDRKHEIVWEFTDLQRPFDADRLANGNTLITDTQNHRVIEVTPDKKIAWSFGLKQAKRKDYKPYDADRLLNGNTLICDHGGKRVIEVTPGGEIVWSIKNLEFLADADRLANGNTLVTRRSPASVVEFNSEGTVVWQLKKLELPGDADRLPDGTTMVSEDGGVKIYSKDGRVVRTLAAEWATEANGY